MKHNHTLRAALLAMTFFSLTSCGVTRWAFEGTETQPSNAKQLGDAAQVVLPAPFGALIGGALGLGALIYASTKKKTPPSPSA